MHPSSLLRLPALLLFLTLPACGALPWFAFDAPVIRPGVGVGPIHFGMKKQEVFDRLGAVSSDSFESYRNASAHGYSYDAKHLYLKIFDAPDAGVQEISISSFRLYPKFPWYIAPRTPSGISLGSTRQQLLAAYGPPSAETTFPDHTAILTYAALGMRFDIDRSGKIDYISLHRPELGDNVIEALAHELAEQRH